MARARLGALLGTAVLVGACHAGANLESKGAAAGSHFLFVWAGDADRRESDFLAVIDADPRSSSYASVVATLPVGATGTMPHHTEHELSAIGELWANGFNTGQTFRFDLSNPSQPRLLGTLTDSTPFSHPHSYVRLSNGNVLATFQRRAGGRAETGGLVEFDAKGKVVRYAPAAAPAIDSGVRPYSLAVVPALDRVVTTATDMHRQTSSSAVQVWRLSDLTLLHTIKLPAGPRGNENELTAEPRLLADGRTVLINTFTCGLYRLRDLTNDKPSAEWIYSSPWQAPPFCAVPVVAGHFWLQTNAPDHAIITLDVSNPSRPREASRVTFARDEIPHWMSLEPNGERVVLTGYRELESRVLLLALNRATGALQVDSTFKTPGALVPGVDFAREQWPHGATGKALPHGAVFSRH